MTYIQLAACFLAAAVVAAVVLSLLARRRGAGPDLGAIALTVLALFILTAVFDTIMIGTGLFHYSGAHLLDIHVGLAPIEDFAYPLAGALLLPSLWVMLRARRSVRMRNAAHESEADA
ncbi:lycopene cyclase domain-containing protein [Microbacterium sp. SSW1-49]|uniref:Lycopene cyclase domain-containing protein n=1 Tax=Microbacterium croceum TaxID=2851645 RepID=A0ABT0FHH3_9MICO|nr:lycopene cyclase domain-containing protein [Microbacterium croceum]MCK2037506.1 lycopene cyclase domain-containing protein [Microbacterium croceum]